MSRVTIQDLLDKKKNNHKIVMLTAYDYTFAKILDQTQKVDVILVGDSVANTLIGYENTLPVTIDEMVYHTKSVSRGVENSMVLADMPFMSYQVSEKDAVFNAGRLVKESNANAVKIEGGKQFSRTIKKIVDIGIPVCGHLGLTPQFINCLSGFKVQGKNLDKIKKMVEDAHKLVDSGVFMIVLECVPDKVGKLISEKVNVPVIGIGAGKYCDGQVLVVHDLLGMFKTFRPKFVKQYVNLYDIIQDKVKEFSNDVQTQKFPNETQSFKIEQELPDNL
jgi:3-methyl-2-oxobutanoate hydroxymethyltransferase